MREGRFRDSFPRLTLTLPGKAEDFQVEFIVDTGFDGYLTLPEHFAQKLNVGEPETRLIRLAGGLKQRCSYLELFLEEEEGEPSLVEVLVLEGNPLMGNLFLANQLLSVELREGGNVSTEYL